jgi:outer membrane protein OmpA-like peptidoglycan-associated protein
MRSILFLFLFLYSPFFLQAQEDVLTVYFNHNEDHLNEKDKVKISELLKNKPELEVISIIAYCDSMGSKVYNFDLAERRLKSVQKLLPKDLLEKTKMLAAGENYPVTAKNTSLKDWRKVEIHYIAERIKTQEIEELNAEVPLKKSVFEGLKLEDVLAENAEPIVLDIQFVPGMDVLYGDSWAEIDKLFLFLKNNDKAHAFIRGHVCCGSDMYLSYARAYTVYNAMMIRGISPKRLDLKGYDNTKPRVWPEVTDEDRQMNRRVDVIFSLKEE